MLGLAVNGTTAKFKSHILMCLLSAIILRSVNSNSSGALKDITPTSSSKRVTEFVTNMSAPSIRRVLSAGRRFTLSVNDSDGKLMMLLNNVDSDSPLYDRTPT